VHAPDGDSREANGGGDEEGVITPTTRRCTSAEQKKGSIGAEDGDDDGENEDTGERSQWDVIRGVILDKPLLV